MGAVYFYHLTRNPLDRSLSMLLGKAQQAGWRIAVRGTDPQRLEWLDDRLWQGADDGFLPHGMAGGPHDGDQPILLTTQTDTQTGAANGATCVMAVDGAAVTPEEVATLDRVCVLFDGTDDEAVQTARVQWKSLTDAGCSAQYWSEKSGQWQKKAER